jgi:hypothetical protein
MVDPSSGDHVIKGRWGLGDEDATGGEWNAYKSKTRQADLEGFGGGTSSGGESESGSDDSTESGGDDGFGEDEEDEDDMF